MTGHLPCLQRLTDAGADINVIGNDGTTAVSLAAGNARHDSAEDFCRLKARRYTAMDWIFILAYCFAIP